MSYPNFCEKQIFSEFTKFRGSLRIPNYRVERIRRSWSGRSGTCEMDKLNPKELLGHAAVSGYRPDFDCPDDQVLTAALDGEFRVIERPAFEKHVSSCDYCLARLGRIARLNREVGGAEISDLTMARAQRLIRSRSVVPRAPAWAAAAMIGFAAILTALWIADSTEPQDATISPVPEVRNIDPEAYRPQVEFPTEGASVDLHDLTFKWSAVPDSLHYDIRIVSADGTMIWQERVQEPQWRLPEHLQLAAGEGYYFRADAYLTRAKSLSSRHVMFRIKKDE